MNEKKFKMVFVGGGTAGHVSPNIAIINEVKKISKKKNMSLELLYVGSIKGIEREIVAKEGLKYKGILTGKLRRYWHWRNLSDVILILIGFFQSFFLLVFDRPDLVFAKGGFVTVPFCLACAVLRIPFLIHESDSLVGLSNRILQPFAKKVYLGFPPEVYGRKMQLAKLLFVGNPVKSDIIERKITKDEFYKKYGLNPKKKVVFIFGGSQGAHAINSLINQLISKIVEKYILIHSTGRASENYFKEGYLALNEKDREDYLVFGYIDEEMSDFLNNADVIVSRAGANSIAEIIAVRKPSIIIPLPSSASQHQRRNASFLQKNGVASVLEEKVLDADRLFKEIESLLSDKKAGNNMIKNMEKVFPENAGRAVAEDMIKMLNGKN